MRPVEAQLVCLLQPANANEFWEKLQLVSQSLSLAQHRSQNDEYLNKSNERSIAMIEKEDLNISCRNDNRVEEALKSLSELRISMLQDREENQRTLKRQMDMLNSQHNYDDNQYQSNWRNPQNYNNENRARETSDGRPICFNCGRPGHRSRFCHFTRFDQNIRHIDSENSIQVNTSNSGND